MNLNLLPNLILLDIGIVVVLSFVLMSRDRVFFAMPVSFSVNDVSVWSAGFTSYSQESICAIDFRKWMEDVYYWHSILLDILVSAKIWPHEVAFSARWNFDEVMFHQHVCITLCVLVCEMSKSSKIHRDKLRNKYVQWHKVSSVGFFHFIVMKFQVISYKLRKVCQTTTYYAKFVWNYVSVYGRVCNNIPETPPDILIEFVCGLYSVYQRPHVCDLDQNWLQTFS